MPVKPPHKSICDFVEASRVMPPGTPFPGPVDLRLTPHIREWLENMSPYSPIQHQAILKAAQIAATFAAECVLGYWMKESPTAIIYASATQALLEKWGTKRLEPMIDSMGIRDLIIQNTESTYSKRSRRTGDKMYSKQFVGGFLEMASLQTPAGLRSDSFRVGVIDEIDGAPRQLVTGEGVARDVIEARFTQFGDRAKIMDMSTPTTIEESLIYEIYQDGDRRHFIVPCPMCGKFQYLKPYPEAGSDGLRGDYKAGKLIQVYYLCDHCHDAIFDMSKYEMFNAGKWEPTTESESPTFRSYYINTLYSPPRTFTWKKYYSEWKTAKNNPEKMRSWTNLRAGLPYREEGTRPKADKIISLRGTYNVKTVQPGVLYLTIGADVQRGKEKFKNFTDQELTEYIGKKKYRDDKEGKSGLPRVELEIVGHGAGYRSWSIDYMVFYGKVDDAFSGAWEDLYQWAMDTRMAFIRADGHVFYPELVFIDSGDGELTGTVYSFTRRFPKNVFPSKGYQAVKRRKNETAGKAKADHDELTDFNFLRYRATFMGDVTVYTISTNYYKGFIYNSLNNIKRNNTPIQRPGFSDFPVEYGRPGTIYAKYFDMLRAEEHLKGGAFTAGGRRNEALDCRVYALCASDVFLDSMVKDYKEIAKNNRVRRSEIDKINTRFVLNQLKIETRNEKYYENDNRLLTAKT